ncbi:site-specific integrase [Niallia taxi]|uniref:site-specific integrase n=1 Tax=Niallia taxi TaxID=2499688 RepID=UPI003981A21B
MAYFRKRNNRWQYRIHYKDPFTGKFREKSKSGFSTKKEAVLAAAKEESRLNGEYGLTESPTLEEFLNEWLYEYKKDTVRKNTFILHEQNIRNHILPYFQNIHLKDIKPIMYQRFLNHLIDEGYSKRTVEIINTTMNNAMEKAVLISKLEKNPCKGSEIRFQRKGKKKERLSYMKSEDISNFLKTAFKYDYYYYFFFKALIETGMRKGEAAALQWLDIDWEESSININKTLDFQAKNNEDLFGDPKTFSSERKILMNRSFKAELIQHFELQKRNKVILGEEYHHELDLVFCRNDGNFLPKSTLFNAFSRILKQAGLSQLAIHSLRHTHAVLLLESGASMKFIQERLGHSSITVTSDVYSHMTKKLEKDSMDDFEEYISKLF